MIKKLSIAAAAIALATTPAFAHFSPIEHGASFMAGLMHPISGLDHILAMVVVGIWAASIGGRAIVGIPAAFVVTMGIGFAAAIVGMPLPLVEPAILASVIALGVLVALALPIPAIGVGCIVAFFALFHGYAHGTELHGAGAWQFAAGFAVSTIVLHIVGIAIGLGFTRFANATRSGYLVRLAGVVTAMGGAWLALAG